MKKTILSILIALILVPFQLFADGMGKINIDSINYNYYSHTLNTIKYEVVSEGWYRIKLVDCDGNLIKLQTLNNPNDTNSILGTKSFEFKIDYIIKKNPYKLVFEYYEYGVWKYDFETINFSINNGSVVLTKPNITTPLNYCFDYEFEMNVENNNLPLDVFSVQNNIINFEFSSKSADKIGIREKILKIKKNSPDIEFLITSSDSVLFKSQKFNIGYTNIELVVDSLTKSNNILSDSILKLNGDITENKKLMDTVFQLILMLNDSISVKDSIIHWYQTHPDTVKVIYIIDKLTNISYQYELKNITDITVKNGYLNINGPKEEIQWYLCDLRGNILKSVTEINSPIYVDDLQSGVYFLYIRNKGIFKFNKV